MLRKQTTQSDLIQVYMYTHTEQLPNFVLRWLLQKFPKQLHKKLIIILSTRFPNTNEQSNYCRNGWLAWPVSPAWFHDVCPQVVQLLSICHLEWPAVFLAQHWPDTAGFAMNCLQSKAWRQIIQFQMHGYRDPQTQKKITHHNTTRHTQNHATWKLPRFYLICTAGLVNHTAPLHGQLLNVILFLKIIKLHSIVSHGTLVLKDLVLTWDGFLWSLPWDLSSLHHFLSGTATCLPIRAECLLLLERGGCLGQHNRAA